MMYIHRGLLMRNSADRARNLDDNVDNVCWLRPVSRIIVTPRFFFFPKFPSFLWKHLAPLVPPTSQALCEIFSLRGLSCIVQLPSSDMAECLMSAMILYGSSRHAVDILSFWFWRISTGTTTSTCRDRRYYSELTPVMWAKHRNGEIMNSRIHLLSFPREGYGVTLSGVWYTPNLGPMARFYPFIY